MVNDPRHPVGMLSEAETAELADRINATPNLQPFTLEETVHRARFLHGEPGPMDASARAYAESIATAVRGWYESQITVSGEPIDSDLIEITKRDDDGAPSEVTWRGDRYVRDHADAFIRVGDELLGGLVERQAVLDALAFHPHCCSVVRRVPYARG